MTEVLDQIGKVYETLTGNEAYRRHGTSVYRWGITVFELSAGKWAMIERSDVMAHADEFNKKIDKNDKC